MFTILTRKTAVLTATGALTALVLAGCGSTSSSTNSAQTRTAPTTTSKSSYGPPANGPHNAQDVAFLNDMLPHHRQAVEMAEMALTRDSDPQVKTLAQQIKGAQAPEIATMSGWLTGWGQPVPAAGAHEMGGMAGGAMNGMMSGAEMTALDAAAGKPFAKLWLTGMTKHHTGAVDMAKKEQVSGQNADAKALAGRIISSQSAEIATMTKLMSTLNG